MTTFKNYYDKYIYAFVKEAAKVRTDRIPKGSIIAKDIAKKYWDLRLDSKGVPKNLDDWEREAIRNDITARINKAQYEGMDKKTVHNMQLSSIYSHAVEDAKQYMKAIQFAVKDLPEEKRQEVINEAIGYVYDKLRKTEKELKDYTKNAYTAENTRQLLLSQVPKKLRKYIKDLPITMGDVGGELYNNADDSSHPNRLGFYNKDEGRVHMSSDQKSQGVATTAGHELDGHGVDASYTDANDEQFNRYMSYNNKKNINENKARYSFKNGKTTVSKPVPMGTMMTESIASTRPAQHMKQVTKTAPKRLGKRLAKNYEEQGNIAYNVYNNRLRTQRNPRKATPDKDQERVGKQIDKDVNALAKYKKISARKELGAMPADKAYNGNERKRSIISSMLESANVPSKDIEPMREMMRTGFSIGRANRKLEAKADKQKRIQEIADRREKLNIRQTTNMYDREQWQKAHPETYKMQQAMLPKKSYYKLFYDMFKRISCNI